ncbi:MAG TPA: hypothetical protein VII16_17920, partial [Actinomycetes bacterium]
MGVRQTNWPGTGCWTCQPPWVLNRLPVAERAGVALRGRPVRVRDGVVDLAGAGRPVAADAAAGAVPGDDVVDQILRWPVAGPAV